MPWMFVKDKERRGDAGGPVRRAVTPASGSPSPDGPPARAAEGAGPCRFPAAVPGLVRACHPQPVLVVTALVTALAVASGRSAGGCVLVAGAVLTGQLSVGWCNDRLDAGRDTAAGRRDKPLVTGAVTARTVTLSAAGALALCVPLSLAGGAAAGAAHLTGVAAAWSYNLGVKRTALSWLPYAVGFGMLPAFVTLGLPGHPWPAAWSMAAGALLGVGAHFTNVLPDIDADLACGVRGLPQRLGHRLSRALAPVPLFAAAALLVFGPPGPAGHAGWGALTVTGALAAATAVPATAGSPSRLPFLTTLLTAATAVGLLILHGGSLA